MNSVTQASASGLRRGTGANRSRRHQKQWGDSTDTASSCAEDECRDRQPAPGAEKAPRLPKGTASYRGARPAGDQGAPAFSFSVSALYSHSKGQGNNHGKMKLPSPVAAVLTRQSVPAVQAAPHATCLSPRRERAAQPAHTQPSQRAPDTVPGSTSHALKHAHFCKRFSLIPSKGCV